jgi:hypothetical protein
MSSAVSLLAALLPGRFGNRRHAYLYIHATACLVVLLLCAPRPAAAQAALHAEETMSPWSLGAGFSNFDLDWGHNRRMDGITAWVDWRIPTHIPLLNRVGIEGEGREIDFLKPSSFHVMRQETALGGVTVELPGHRRLHPYAKYLMGVGSVHFASSGYSHDSRKVYAPGGGVDWRLHHYGLSVRAEYEYQYWHHLFGPHDLSPNGVTVGVVWNVAHR